MKQKILNLKKKLLIVELPEGANDIKHPIDRPHMMSYKLKGHRYQFSTIAKSVLIGKLTDITEEQFAEWVEQYMVDKWRNYLTEIQYVEYLKSTAKESFFSYLEANGIYFENPIEKPIMEEYGYCEERDAEGHLYKSYWEPQEGEEEWQEAINEWWEAEQKVWSKDRCYLFEII